MRDGKLKLTSQVSSGAHSISRSKSKHAPELFRHDRSVIVPVLKRDLPVSNDGRRMMTSDRNLRSSLSKSSSDFSQSQDRWHSLRFDKLDPGRLYSEHEQLQGAKAIRRGLNSGA